MRAHRLTRCGSNSPNEAGSNRIEEGFVITDDGPVSFTPYTRQLCERGVISTEELSAGMRA